MIYAFILNIFRFVAGLIHPIIEHFMPTFERSDMKKRHRAFPNEILKKINDVEIDLDNKSIDYDKYCKYRWDIVFVDNDLVLKGVLAESTDYPIWEPKKLLIQGFIYQSLMKYIEVLESAIKEKDYLSTCMSLEGLGHIYIEKGDIEISTKFYKKAFEIYSKLEFGHGQIDNLINIGNTNVLQGELSGLDELLKHIEVLSDNLKYNRGFIGATQIRAKTLAYQGDLNTALNNSTNALDMIKELGEDKEIADQYCEIADIYGKMYYFDKAINYIKKAQSIYRKIGFKKGIGKVFSKMGWNFYGLEYYDKALKYSNKAIIIFEGIENTFDKADTMVNIANIYREKKDAHNSIAFYNEADKIFADCDFKMGQARVQWSYGLLMLAVDDLDRAEKYLLKAIGFYKGSGLTYFEALINGDLGMVYFYKNNYIKALNFLRKSVSQIGKINIQLNIDMLLNTIDICEHKI